MNDEQSKPEPSMARNHEGTVFVDIAAAAIFIGGIYVCMRTCGDMLRSVGKWAAERFLKNHRLCDTDQDPAASSIAMHTIREELLNEA